MIYGNWMPSQKISKLLDIHDPFLFVDRARLFNYNLLSGAQSEYVVDSSHWIFKSHMRNNPVFPGALLGECLCQTAMIDVYSRLKSELNRGLLRSTDFTFLNKVTCETGPVTLIAVAKLLSLKRGVSTYALNLDDYNSGKRIAQGSLCHVIPFMPGMIKNA
jgi:3-hydroxymyristoyl/3-hydroxydecanoyl-(acyl carrier protein) dehydratase